MIIKKFYGKSIRKARERACDALEEECVVLETTEADGQQEASVSVLLDAKNAKRADAPDSNEVLPGIYSRKDLIPKSIDKIKAVVKEGINQFKPEIAKAEQTETQKIDQKTTTPDKQQGTDTKPQDSKQGMSRRGTSLYERSQVADKQSEEIKRQVSQEMSKEIPVSKEVKALHRRFDHLESLLSEALISANLSYVSHPAFQQLLGAGIQAPTISAWFEKVLSKGIDPYEQSQSFMFELAGIIRSVLKVALPEAPAKNLLFAGPSGAGKSTLIMKLVENKQFMGDKNVALVSIEPANFCKRYSVLGMFAKDYGLPHHTVKNGVEMGKLAPELEAFDHVLFDSPSISLQQEAAFRDFWKIRQIISSVAPLEVHYTVNATLERYYFKERYVANHPLQPDYIAITHLDEIDQWGRLIPFIENMGCSVRYVSQSARLTDGLHLFKPEWFAEKILSHT